MTWNVYTTLRDANRARQAEWDPSDQITLSYRGNEMGGECGEAQNVIKKLERERFGIRGSRATVADLGSELADVVICADLIAMSVGLDLDQAVAAKFNETSEKVGLSVRLEPEAERARWVCRVGEVIDEGDGVWVACSGCQESVDGYVSTIDYPYSAAFRCQPGGGCGSCGGLGVRWDATDYGAEADAMAADLAHPERAWAKYQNDFDAMSDAEVDAETRHTETQASEAEEWLEAVEAWNAAGRPRRSKSVSRETVEGAMP